MEQIYNLIGANAADALFYIFAGLTLLCGLMVIANPFSRNPVTSAMFLVLTIISMTGLFLLLHAFFLAAVQIIVYAGAVLVLFVFVIMLLDLKEEERRRMKLMAVLGGLLSVGTLLSILLKSLGCVSAVATPPTHDGDTYSLGKLLFTQYTLPFEVVSILLLVAMIGCDPFEQEETGIITMHVGLHHYLTVSILLFCLGLLGVIMRRNLLVMYMSLELMLNAANLALVSFSRYNDKLDGQVVVFFIITVAAAEVAVGLALIVALYRKRQSAHVEDLTSMKL